MPWWAFGYLRPYWFIFGIGILAALGAALLDVVFPLIVRFLVDDVLPHKLSHKLTEALVLFLVTSWGSLLLHFGRACSVAFVKERIGADLRAELSRHLAHVPMVYFHKHRSGEIASLFVNDVRGLCTLYDEILSRLLMNIFRLSMALVIVASIFHRLLILGLLSMPLYVLYPLLLGRSSRKAGVESQQRQANLLVGVQEYLNGNREIRAFNAEEREQTRLRKVFTDLIPAQLRLAFLQAGSLSSAGIYYAAAALIYWIGGRAVFRNELTVGSLIAGAAYLVYFSQPIDFLINVNTGLQALRGAADRIYQFLQTPTERADSSTITSTIRRPGLVDFNRVSFSYAEGGEPALTDVTFAVYPGQKILITGPTGSGKTTLLFLLLRFVEPTSGKILIDGQDIKHLTLGLLRDRIGVVFQDSFLFARTVRENLLLAAPGAQDEQLIRALQAASADEFVMQLPGGLNAEIGERGVTLSGGERQRIAIARTLLRNSGVLVFDEATSALDSRTEHELYSRLDQYLANQTFLIVTHRVSTVMNPDMIIVLDRGQIAAIGKHEELIERCVLYRKLYALQTTLEEDSLVSASKSIGAFSEVKIGRMKA